MTGILTKTSARDAIDACLEKVADLVATGATPDNAIAEAVKQANMHPSGVQILVQAYNTAAINQQRLNGSDIAEKTAAVPLADADLILETLFPTPHEPAHIGHLGSPATLRKIASESRPKSLSDNAKAGLSLLKSARAAETKQAADSAEVGYYKHRNDCLKKEAAANRELFMAGTKLAGDIERLTTFLQQESAPAVAELAPRVKVAIGEHAVDVLYALATPLNNLKLASKCRDFAAAVDMVRVVTDGLERYQEVKQAADCAKDAVPPAKMPVKAMHGTKSILDSDNDGVMAALNANDTGEKVAQDKSAAGPFTTAAVMESMRQLSDKLRAGLQSDPVEKNLSALSDPMHERRLQQIRSQATLIDLMNNDNVISGYDPDEVIASWNQLLELSPQIGDKRILAQNALRTRLAQGSLDPFATSQLVDVGQKLTPKPPAMPMKSPNERQFGRN